MNALASDQAERLAAAIYNNPLLKGKITAGIYVGDKEQDAATPLRLFKRNNLPRKGLSDSAPNEVLLNTLRVIALRA